MYCCLDGVKQKKEFSEVALPSAMVMALGKENTETILKHVFAECWDRALGKENTEKILKQVFAECCTRQREF